MAPYYITETSVYVDLDVHTRISLEQQNREDRGKSVFFMDACSIFKFKQSFDLYTNDRK